MSMMDAVESTLNTGMLSGIVHSLPATAIIPYLLLACLSWIVFRRCTTLDLLRIPSPWGIPILGHLIQMAMHVSNGHEQFVKWHEAYGSIVRIRILHRDLVLVADPQVASELLSKGTNECPRRTPEYTIFNVAHGMPGCSAILTEQDEERWRAIRKAIAPAYALSAVRELFPTIVKCYAEVCERIISEESLHYPSSSSGSSSSSSKSLPEVLIDEEIFAATIQILTDGFLKMPREGLFDIHKTAAHGGSLVAITNTFVTQPWKKWLYLGFPWLCKESRVFHKQRRRMMAVTEQIARHIESVRPAAFGDSSLAACLSRVMEPSTGEPFSRQALQAEIFLEIVGQESVPWTLAWTLYLLTQHPEAETAVLDELQAAGVPCNGDLAASVAALNMDMIKQLPYCTAVLHEAMRMFPAGVAATPRMTDKVTQVGPYRVPAGVIVFPCLYSILMYSGNWDEPYQFKPERWLDNPNYGTDPRTGAPRFVPFGIGPKACVAQQLAMVQCKVLMVLLLSCCSWRLAPRMGGPDGVMAQTVAALELRVAQGMWLNPLPRGNRDSSGGSSRASCSSGRGSGDVRGSSTGSATGH